MLAADHGYASFRSRTTRESESILLWATGPAGARCKTGAKIGTMHVQSVCASLNLVQHNRCRNRLRRCVLLGTPLGRLFCLVVSAAAYDPLISFVVAWKTRFCNLRWIF